MAGARDKGYVLPSGISLFPPADQHDRVISEDHSTYSCFAAGPVSTNEGT
jgi:hypothetical protein